VLDVCVCMWVGGGGGGEIARAEGQVGGVR